MLRNAELYLGKRQAVMNMHAMDIDGKDIIASSSDIEVENAEFSYDKRKIKDGVSIDTRQHTISAIVGPSGGGKTTICHLISANKGCGQGMREDRRSGRTGHTAWTV
jgi:ABC-type cobalamin/Fe3+-siderophores transport systems, ATPase components